MLTPKIVLYESKLNSDGTHPVVIQISFKGLPKKKTICSVFTSQWDTKKAKVNKKHPFADQLNKEIEDEYLATRERIRNGAQTPDEVFGRAEKKIKAEQGKKDIKINDYWLKIVKRYIEEDKESMANQTDIVRRDFLLYSPKFESMKFEDVDIDFILGFYSYITNTIENKKNTTQKKMSRVRTVFKKARIEKITTANPFEGLTFKGERTRKRKLNTGELKTVDSDGLEKFGNNVHVSRDMFMTSFYLRGIRIGDLLRLKDSDIDFRNGEISFVEGKTKNERRFKMRPELIAIISKYYTGENKYLFPMLKYEYVESLSKLENSRLLRKKIKSATSVINNSLKKIKKHLNLNKPLTNHIARHTFGKMAIDTIKNVRITKDLVGHSSLAEHQRYIEDLSDNDELDDAAGQVFFNLK